MAEQAKQSSSKTAEKPPDLPETPKLAPEGAEVV